jgi:hypothetical protein
MDCLPGWEGRKPAVHNLFRGKLMATYMLDDGEQVSYASYWDAIDNLIEKGFNVIKDGTWASNRYSYKPRLNMEKNDGTFVTVLFNNGNGFIRG